MSVVSSLRSLFSGLRRCLWLTLVVAGSVHAYQGSVIEPLRVEGRFLVNASGRRVNLHGWMQPAASWFNGEGRNFVDPKDFTNIAQVAPLVEHLRTVANIMSNPRPTFAKTHGWASTFVRFIGDNGGVSNFAPGWNAAGVLDRPAQFEGWINHMLVPYLEHCRSVGLYVVICGNPSVAYPAGNVNRNMTQQYQTNLITFWTTLANHPAIRNADNVMFEICNEPITIETQFGSGVWGGGSDPYWSAHAKFLQPIVDAIRATGANNIIWLPGLGWQGEYQGFVKYPVTGTNLGYAAHLYPAYGAVYDNPTAVRGLWNRNYKPAADQLPMMITELMWEPNDGKGYQDLWNASTEGFGLAVRACFDDQENVSYLIGMTGDVIGNINAGLSKATYPTVQGAQAAYAWWPTYASTDPQHTADVGAQPATLFNLSTRSIVGIDARTQIAGFVITGSEKKKVLIRGSGPSLTPFGVKAALADPVLTLFDATRTVLASNDNWDAATQQAVSNAAGAFAWAPGSLDAALVVELTPGQYTAQVAAKNGAAGVGLVEIYDLDATDTGSRLTNLSTRSETSAGETVQIAGFVLKGNGPRRVLVRASGPALTEFAVNGAVSDPKVTVFNADGYPLLRNDDWSEAAIEAVAKQAGAFAWKTGSKDAALIATLRPGNYTVHVATKGTEVGVALVEIYELP